MTLKFIKTTNNFAFIVDEKDDVLRAQLDIIFGVSVHLFFNHIITDKNEDGTDMYSDYIVSRPIQICHKSDIVDERDANSVEVSIFNHLQSKRKLSKLEREYLKANFYFVLDNRNDVQETLF